MASPRPLRCAALALLVAAPGAAHAHAEAASGSWWLWPVLLAGAALYAIGVRRLWRASGGRRGIRAGEVGVFVMLAVV